MEQHDEIELREILFILKRHLKLIAVIPLVAMLTAAIISIFVIQPPVPMYKAETTLLVNMKVPGSDNLIIDDSILNLNKKLIPTYIELVNSRKVSTKAKELLKEKMGREDVTGKVAVEQVPNTDLMKVSFEDKDPKVAAFYVNTVAQVFAKEVQNMMDIDNVKVIDAALAPETTVTSGTKKVTLNVIIGGIVGLMAAIGLAFLMEFLSNTFKRPEDIKRELGLPILGAIKGKESEELVMLTTPEAPTAEAYRILTANLQYGFNEKPIKKILITSSAQKEGKAKVAANLGAAMAQAGYSVILLDGNFRAPQLHQIFSIENKAGLTDVLINQKPLSSVLQATAVEGLKVITTGSVPQNTSKMLSSKNAKSLFEELAEHNDYIIVNSPDVLSAADAVILATLCDGVLLTVDADKTKIDEAKQAIDSLGNVRASIIGTVYNKVSA